MGKLLWNFISKSRDILLSIRMIRIVPFLMLFLSVSFVNADPVSLTQQDVDEFYGFVDDYRSLASKYVDESESKSISDLFYTDNNKLLSKTEKFLKKKGWNYLQFNDFIYIVSIALDAIDYYEEYGYPDEPDPEDPFVDVTKEVIDLVKKERQRLRTYFPPLDLDAMMDEFAEYEDLDAEDIEDVEDIKTTTTIDTVPEDNTITSDDKEVPVDSSLLGEYSMDIENDKFTKWGNFLKLKSIKSGYIIGEVGIDWGIGAEARMPKDWEMLYTAPFKAKINGSDFTFTAKAAEGFSNETKYIFKLSATSSGINGIVTIIRVQGNKRTTSNVSTELK